MKTSVRYSDLGPSSTLQAFPTVADELPELYNTLLSTVDWFETHDGSTPTGACILERPRHVLLFCQAKDTVEILNKEFAIAPGDVERACRALFRTFPQTRRIHVEVLFPPEELRLPKRVLYGADHMVVDFPRLWTRTLPPWARERVGKCDAAGGISRRSEVPSPSRLSLPASRPTNSSVHSSRGRTCASTRRARLHSGKQIRRPAVTSPSPGAGGPTPDESGLVNGARP